MDIYENNRVYYVRIVLYGTVHDLRLATKEPVSDEHLYEMAKSAIDSVVQTASKQNAQATPYDVAAFISEHNPSVSCRVTEPDVVVSDGDCG